MAFRRYPSLLLVKLGNFFIGLLCYILYRGFFHWVGFFRIFLFGFSWNGFSGMVAFRTGDGGEKVRDGLRDEGYRAER